MIGYRLYAELAAALILIAAFAWWSSHERSIGESKCVQAQQEAVNKALSKQAADAQMEINRRAELERSRIAQLQAITDAKDKEIARLQSIKPETLIKTVTVHDQVCPTVSLGPDVRQLWNNTVTGDLGSRY